MSMFINFGENSFYHWLKKISSFSTKKFEKLKNTQLRHGYLDFFLFEKIRSQDLPQAKTIDLRDLDWEFSRFMVN